MSELEELPSWAGRSVSSQKSSSDPAGQVPNQEPATAANPIVNAGQAAEHGVVQGQANIAEHGRVVQQQTASQTEQLPGGRRRKPWLMFLFGFLGLMALVGMGALGYLLAQSQNSSETATSSGTEADAAVDADAADGGSAADSETAAETEDAADQAPVAVETDTTDDAAAGTDGAADDNATGDTEDGTAAGATDDTAEGGGDDAAAGSSTDGSAPSDSERQAIFRAGKVYLSGPVPSEEVGQLIEQKAAAVVGPDNVVNEYVIDPTSEILPGSSAPLYVEDVVLFPFNSVEIASPFLPILDLGTLLLRQNPQATITVVTRTDAVGSEEVNLDVSTKRAQAIINYWLSKGVSQDQIIADPRGEEGASEADDEEAAALRRRAEFIITGLLD